MRRCRPLLGTYVEINAVGFENRALICAVDKAFAEIERIQWLMSVHASDSELSRVNEEAFCRSVKLSDNTFEVLDRGLDIARASEGAFDFTIAPMLASWGLLPAHLRRREQGNWRDVHLQSRQRVRFLRPLAIDLGGIAKGFAVDAAIVSLRASEVVAASVNAGGDLRVYGPDESRIHLRHPVLAQPVSQAISVRNAALATSSPCFTLRKWRGRTVSHLINPRERHPITESFSVSVKANECWLADALTKVILNADRATATRLLAAHEAEALILGE